MGKIRQTHLGTVLLFSALCAAAVWGILFCPISRQAGLTFRNTLYVFPLLFIMALVTETVSGRFWKAVLMSLLFAAVLMPYSGLINSGASEQYALGGVIPWSDAFTMQLNTQRFLYGGLMEQAAALRPLSLVFYGLFLRFSGNNYFALQVFLCVLTALCLLAAMESVSRSFGPFCGAMFFTILYYYIRKRQGTFMTEPYGFICGLLCCGLFLNGIRGKDNLRMLSGFLFLSIGLNARPAAMFLLPAAGLWYFLIFTKNDRRRLILSGAAAVMILAGFSLNRLAQKAVYGEEKIPNRQAAEMVYGLCLGGKGWGEVTTSPEMTAINQSDNVIRDTAALCGPILREHPENILSAFRTIFYDSLIRSEYYGAFSFINGNPQRLQTPVRYLMMVLWFSGFLILFRRRKEFAFSFLLFCVPGIVLSECAAVPFSTNYLRLYAVSMFIPACITGLPVQTAANRIFSHRLNQVPGNSANLTEIPLLLSAMLILFGTLGGPGFIRLYPLERITAKSGICSQGEDILLTSIDPGSFIYMTEISDSTAIHIPYFRLPYVRQHFHDTASFEMFEFTDEIVEPTAVIRGIDLGNLQDALIFAPLEMVEGRTGNVQFCGNFIKPPILRNDRFFIPTSIFFFEDSL